jgi:ATP-dependent Clp protease ATP-binding subunit ClpA
MVRNKEPQLRSVLSNADVQAKRYGHEHAGTGHLLLGMTMTNGSARELLAIFRVTEGVVRKGLLAHCERGLYRLEGTIRRTPRAQKILRDALERQVVARGHDILLAEHLLLALLEPIDDNESVDPGDCALRVMRSFVALDELREAAEHQLTASYAAYLEKYAASHM